jgi:hypothetical protein
VDLSIHGHTHRPAFHARDAIGNPYPVLIGGGPDAESATVIVLQADAQRLTAQALNTAGGEVLPKFEVEKDRDPPDRDPLPSGGDEAGPAEPLPAE